MPEGNNVILIWVFLISEAGKCNKNGGLFLTDLMPFNVDDLAIEFDFEVDVIRLALNILEKFEMIEIFEDVIYIKNWGEYQNIEGMDKIREQTRLRNVKYRQKQKLLNDVSVTSHDATELEKELELEEEKEEEIKKPPLPSPKELSIDYNKIKEDFNIKCTKLNPITTMTTKRKQSILARVKENGIESIDIVFENSSKSKFMSGDNDRNWTATFDWIMKPSNYIKVLEGNYKDKEATTNSGRLEDVYSDDMLDEIEKKAFEKLMRGRGEVK
jgi:predicted phage replisome organizer